MPDADKAQITTPPPNVKEKTPSVLNLLVTKASFPEKGFFCYCCLIEVKLLYNVVIPSAVQQRESATWNLEKRH